MRRNDIRRNEKPSSLASQLSYWWCSTSLDYNTDYVANTQRVTRKDIQEYVKKYVIGKPYVAGMIISPEMNKSLNTSSFFKF
jgi:zinc protease